jgi:hypothetical protein
MMVAQQHSGINGWRRKGQLMGRAAPFKGRMKRWPRAAETVGGTAGGSDR